MVSVMPSRTVWYFYVDGDDDWKAFPRKACDVLEKACQEGDRGILKSPTGSATWVMDFQEMTRVNLESGLEQKLKRELLYSEGDMAALQDELARVSSQRDELAQKLQEVEAQLRLQSNAHVVPTDKSSDGGLPSSSELALLQADLARLAADPEKLTKAVKMMQQKKAMVVQSYKTSEAGGSFQ